MEKRKITEPEACKKYHVSQRHFFRWRQTGDGPPWYDLRQGQSGKPLVRYDPEELEEWFKRQRKNPTILKD